MRRLRLIAGFVALITLWACGGGGGGSAVSNATVSGRVLSIETGSATNPLCQVKIAGQTITTEADGTFQATVANGTASLTIDTRSSWGSFVYSFPAASGTVDLGDLWVGPGKITLKGRVISSATDLPIEAADVTFAGRSVRTGADGKFSIANVAYSGSTQAVFWGIVGKVAALGFFATEFTTQPKVAINAIVQLDDVRMTPNDDIDPPPAPFNLWGRVSPAASAPGTVATLKESGVPIRTYTVGVDERFMFWVPPGTYTIECSNGALTGSTTGTITAANQVVRRDVTIQ